MKVKKIRNEVIKFNFNGINIFSIFNKNIDLKKPTNWMVCSINRKQNVFLSEWKNYYKNIREFME